MDSLRRVFCRRREGAKTFEAAQAPKEKRNIFPVKLMYELSSCFDMSTSCSNDTQVFEEFAQCKRKNKKYTLIMHVYVQLVA
jgi:hypothetical protein